MNTDKIYAESIAKDYAPKDNSKIIALKKLDAKAKLPATVFTYTFGIISSLVAGLGMCLAMQVIGGGVVMMVCNALVLQLAGTVGVAAYGVVANIALVVTAIATGIAQGMQPLVSRSVGLGQRRESRRLLRWGLATVLAIKEGLRTPLEWLLSVYPARAVRYFLIVVWAGLGWPSTFRFFAKLGVKHELRDDQKL